METQLSQYQSLVQRADQLRLQAFSIAEGLQSGSFHSLFKGHGIEFTGVREYLRGDDVRTIDWNVTARFHRPFVKVFEEERELTVMLMIDVSGSLDFGTRSQMKREMVTEMAATLAFSAIQNNDKIGVIFFSDRIEKYIPPKKGKKHVLYIIREVLDFQPESKKTDISQALEFLGQVMKRKCTAFVMSDFYDRKPFLKPLQVCRSKHDLMAIQVYDPIMKMLPDVGLLRVRDAETGHEMYIDTSSKALRTAHSKYWQERSADLKQTFAKSSVDFVSVATDGDYVKSLRQMFAMRGC